MNHWFFPVFLVAIAAFPATAAEDGFVSLCNGKDLSGWDGNPALWKVVDGVITGTCPGPDLPEHNEFLIWRGGVVRDFELRVVARVRGDNNSGIQYRSHELPEVGPWAISGYQCDIHPAREHNGMTYEEKGRGIFGLNGQSVILDPERQRWLVAEHAPVDADVAEWTEYTIIARGNYLEHRINGQVSSRFTDFDETGRALQGLLAIQLHRGNAHTVEIREIRLKVLPEGVIVPFFPSLIPPGSSPMPRPVTRNPQGLGKPDSPAVPKS